jgi:drug/metabolite transporter (DMT)-like permease
VLAVLVVTQPVGLVIALAVVATFGADPLPADKTLIAFAGGVAGLGALGAFYTALAMGTMSVVAPIAALGVVVPVAVGVAGGEAPGAVQFAGLTVAIAGVVVLSFEEKEEEDGPDTGGGARAVVLALISALGFGLFFTLLDVAAVDRPGWTITAARAGGAVAVVAAVLAVRPALGGIPAVLPALIAVGCFDILANTLFTVASTMGLLPVVAVGGSMYPAFTIVLAHIVLGERLRTPQRVGVVLALAGVVAIAAGS